MCVRRSLGIRIVIANPLSACLDCTEKHDRNYLRYTLWACGCWCCAAQITGVVSLRLMSQSSHVTFGHAHTKQNHNMQSYPCGPADASRPKRRMAPSVPKIFCSSSSIVLELESAALTVVFQQLHWGSSISNSPSSSRACHRGDCPDGASAASEIVRGSATSMLTPFCRQIWFRVR